MRLVKPYDMLEIMGKTLSYMEPRLVNHGKRVAYLTFKILKALNTYNENDMRDICMTALLHDIGAYKTEEIEKLVHVDAGSTWDHSIYGYLFLKYFSPLGHMASPVLFHHAPYQMLTELEPDEEMRRIAQILQLADRADILSQPGVSEYEFISYFEHGKGVQFEPDLTDAFIQAGIMPLFEVGDDYIRLMQGLSLTQEQVLNYLMMTVFSIDYRSRHTVNHTIGTVKASEMLAKLAGLEETTIEHIQAGAMVHDLGKTGIPVEILESEGKLSLEEMTIMKTHINMTYAILEGHISEEIMRIAARHHEKLNGKGYILGLSAADLTVPERILGVADVFSALYGVRSYKESMPPDKIKRILLSMRDSGHLDGQIVQLAVDNCDAIIEEINKASAPLFDAYDGMQDEYAKLHYKYTNISHN